MRRSTGRSVATITVLLAALLSAATAHGLTLTAPSELLGPTDITVRLDAAEPDGVVTLFDAESPVGSAPATGGVALFAAVALAPGDHVLGAALLGSDGVTYTAEPVNVYAWGAPERVQWKSPKHRTVISPATIRVRAGASTATVTLSVDGHVRRETSCTPGSVVEFDRVKLGTGENRVEVTSVSRTGESTSAVRTLKRYEWRYSTCIVIDKSQFKLYWVKHQQLVKTYRVAHGRYNWTPVRTWKILAKYKTDPHGIYGPRKMRMFKRVGTPGHYRYVFTRYAIHGTNQPWVIGTMASHGCIRMYNRSVLDLYPRVPLGTYVITRP